MALTARGVIRMTPAVRRAQQLGAIALGIWGMLAPIPMSAAHGFRVATYNLENYLDQPAGTRPLKTPEAKAKIRESLRALNADIVALQEMGTASALAELRASLKTEGLDYPFWE